MGDDKVLVTTTYGATNKATGKSLEQDALDVHQWTVKDGKVVAVKFFWGNIAELDAIFEPKATPLSHIQSMFMDWGSGKWATDEADALTEKYFAEDVVTYANGDAKNTDIYKTYKGRAGVKEWIKNLESMDFLEFTPTFVANGDQVFASTTYGAKNKETGKSTPEKVTDMHTWTVKDGKVASVKFFWGNIAALDATFAKDE